MLCREPNQQIRSSCAVLKREIMRSRLAFDLCKKQFSAPFVSPALITRKSKIGCLSQQERKVKRRRERDGFLQRQTLFARR